MSGDSLLMGRNADEIFRLVFTSEFLLESMLGRDSSSGQRPMDMFLEIKTAAAVYVAGLREAAVSEGGDIPPSERILLRELAYIQMLVQALFLRRAGDAESYSDTLMLAARDAARATAAILEGSW